MAVGDQGAGVTLLGKQRDPCVVFEFKKNRYVKHKRTETMVEGIYTSWLLDTTCLVTFSRV